MRAWAEARERLLQGEAEEAWVGREIVGRRLTSGVVLLNPFVPKRLPELGDAHYALLPWSSPKSLTRSPEFTGFLEEVERSRARRYPGFPVVYAVATRLSLPWREPWAYHSLGRVELILRADAPRSWARLGLIAVSGLDLARGPSDPAGLEDFLREAYARRQRLEERVRSLMSVLLGQPEWWALRRLLEERDTRRAERALGQLLKRLPPEALIRLL